MKEKVRKAKNPKRTCYMCVNCRSTFGDPPLVYCSLMSKDRPLPPRVCSLFAVPFVDGFAVPIHH